MFLVMGSASLASCYLFLGLLSDRITPLSWLHHLIYSVLCSAFQSVSLFSSFSSSRSTCDKLCPIKAMLIIACFWNSWQRFQMILMLAMQRIGSLYRCKSQILFISSYRGLRKSSSVTWKAVECYLGV